MFAEVIAKELALPAKHVERTVALLKEGATIPFLARYRKEQTGGLDEVQIGKIQERAQYLDELAARKETVLASIGEQGKLTPELEKKIRETLSRTELEDLYLPYKPRRRTRATLARERGLEPLADLLWAQEASLPEGREALGRRHMGDEVLDAEAAWQGARDIVAERIAEDADVRSLLRELTLRDGVLVSRKARAKKDAPDPDPEGKFAMYYELSEPVTKAASHRVLAIYRGEREGVLRAEVDLDREAALAVIRGRVVRNPKAALAADLEQALCDSYDRLLRPSIETDVRVALKQRADDEAIRVFAQNLEQVLMAAPFGPRPVVAVDPGFRTGCKVVALDETGTLLADGVIYPHEPRKDEAGARRTLSQLAHAYRAEAVAVGNGTAGRETMALCRAMKQAGELPDGCVVVSVNESGASVYSASEVAREEMPDKDVTVRGAVSIGRRLQDPLAELVKIDPKSIGVGQYQHDVNQAALKRALGQVVESCVNRVGVELNTASASLLSHVAGIGPKLARAIVEHRTANGPFESRRDIKKVPRLGDKAFEQAAGFLRVRRSKNPLDRSAVHPESYDVVERMAADLGVGVDELVGSAALVERIDIKRYVDERRGEPTLRDILAELEKPGRDPRDQFEEVGFRDDVTEIEHLEEGMILEGVVTNVTNFGAFVDIGVHQDGLVHVSELAHRFVKDPAEVVKAGDRVKVKVLSVEVKRRRIGLSIKQTQAAPARREPGSQRPGARRRDDRSREKRPFNAIRFTPRKG